MTGSMHNPLSCNPYCVGIVVDSLIGSHVNGLLLLGGHDSNFIKKYVSYLNEEINTEILDGFLLSPSNIESPVICESNRNTKTTLLTRSDGLTDGRSEFGR